jgi:serine-type D-Ala-D-Ala carboxypeptidase (penicillin-binding protein 5/6)
MRAFLTALAAAALVVAGPASSGERAVADDGPFSGPVGGDRLGTGPGVVTAGDVPPPPNVPAASWLVADLDTGAVLAAKAPHAKFRPASTLKTLTALVLLPRLKPNAIVIGKDEDAGIEGSKVGVYPGLKYSVDLLFLGLFLNSGNDAVNALARSDDGGVPATVRRMNAMAEQLGAYDTHVVDPTGLDSDGQYSSAYDLALISRAGLQRKDFRRYATTKLAYFPATNGGKYQISNQNHLLWTYPGALGVKTGYTTLARNTFVGAAQRDGHRLVVTLMNAPHGITADAAALLDWAFQNRAGLHPVGTLIKPAGGIQIPSTARQSGNDAAPVVHPPDRALAARDTVRIAQDAIAGLPPWLFAVPPLLFMLLLMRARAKAHRARVKARATDHSGRHRR